MATVDLRMRIQLIIRSSIHSGSRGRTNLIAGVTLILLVLVASGCERSLERQFTPLAYDNYLGYDVIVGNPEYVGTATSYKVPKGSQYNVYGLPTRFRRKVYDIDEKLIGCFNGIFKPLVNERGVWSLDNDTVSMARCKSGSDYERPRYCGVTLSDDEIESRKYMGASPRDCD